MLFKHRPMYAAFLFAACGFAHAQTPPPASAAPVIQRQVLQTVDLGDKLKVLFTVEMPAGTSIARHWHHGVESGYVLDGCAQVDIDGQPPKQLKKGESFSIPQGVVHRGLPCEGQSAKVLAVYVIEKGKPQAVPADAPAASKP